MEKIIKKSSHRPITPIIGIAETGYWNRGSKIESRAVCEIIHRSELFEKVYEPTFEKLEMLSEKYLFLNFGFDIAYEEANLAILGAVYLLSQRLTVPKSQTKLVNHIKKTDEFLKKHSIDLKRNVINQ